MGYKSLRILKEDPIAEVVLIGPGKGNAMGPDFWKEMPELFSSLDRDERVRAVLQCRISRHEAVGHDRRMASCEPSGVEERQTIK